MGERNDASRDTRLYSNTIRDPGRLHLEDLQGAVDAFGRVVENEARVGDVSVEQFVLPAAVVEIAIVNLAILVDVIIQRQLRLAEVCPSTTI